MHIYIYMIICHRIDRHVYSILAEYGYDILTVWLFQSGIHVLFFKKMYRYIYIYTICVCVLYMYIDIHMMHIYIYICIVIQVPG